MPNDIASSIEREAVLTKRTRSLRLSQERLISRESLRRALAKTVFYSLLALIALAAIPYGAVEPWWEALIECSVFVLAALAVIESWMSSEKALPQWKLFLPLVGLIFLAIIQTLPLVATDGATSTQSSSWQTISADPFETRLVALKFIALMLVGWLLLKYTSTRFRLAVLIHLLLGIAVLSALFGLARQAAQHDSQSFLLVLPPNKGYGQFINVNHFALLMEMSLGLGLGLLLGGGIERRRSLIYLGLIVPIGAALIFSNSRGGILGMMCSIVFLLLLVSTSRRQLNMKRRKRGRLYDSLAARIALAAVLIVAVCLSIIWIGGDQLEKRFDGEHVAAELSRPEEAATRARRIDIWRATLSLIEAHPLAGAGFGGYGAAITEFYAYTGERRLLQAHNEYLELLASGGIIALLLSLWFIVMMWRAARGRLRSVDSFYRAAALGALTGISAVAVHSLFDFGLHTTINALVFTALLAILFLNRSDGASRVLIIRP